MGKYWWLLPSTSPPKDLHLVHLAALPMGASIDGAIVHGGAEVAGNTRQLPLTRLIPGHPVATAGCQDSGQRRMSHSIPPLTLRSTQSTTLSYQLLQHCIHADARH